MKPFRCGHAREAGNIMYEYGYQRCRTCKRNTNRRAQDRHRAEFIARYGKSTAVPVDEAA